MRGDDECLYFLDPINKNAYIFAQHTFPFRLENILESMYNESFMPLYNVYFNVIFL